MLPLLLVTVFTLLDRLTKAIAVIAPTASSPLLGRALSFESAANLSGPLGLPVPWPVALPLAIGLGLVLFVAALAEPRSTDQALLLAVIFGVLSNTYDRAVLGYIIDTFRFVPGLAFNVADLLIVAGAVGRAGRLAVAHGR